ncbi:hypothetical protein BISA_2068 [Bifidobacterium saguini DSM 23967]|uniref:DUF559 domain-containing protein n=4 Tax=Bifidobacterium TaxID=1678 RepID=A0ABX7S233_9BIFI|nr:MULTISPECIES: hypothetical protein [Bifidobacterium]KFI91105.1 hypothetical protein BISA_2068 [Bifidobacterium saguini DSM 23967]QSY58278.1 hypothetical protein BLI708_02950 [Bifidobacterium imperatoris]QTB90033.1 hypothetical protein BSD967_06585 [Bifidobacterium saguini]
MNSTPPSGVFEDERILGHEAEYRQPRHTIITDTSSATMHENLAQQKRDTIKRCTDAAQQIKQPLLFGMTTSLLLQSVPVPSGCAMDATVLHTVSSSHRKRLRTVSLPTVPHVWKPLHMARNVRINKYVYALDLVHTWAQLASHCSLESLIILADAIITAIARQPNLAHGRNPEGIQRDMAACIRNMPKFNAKSSCLLALKFTAPYVDSPKESEIRITTTKYGLPQSVTNYVVPGITFKNGSPITVDLAWPEFRVAIEYDGDQHRTDKAQWRRDQEKREKLRHHDWVVIIATASNLADEPSRAELAYHAARQLTLRGASTNFTVTETPLAQIAQRKQKQ